METRRAVNLAAAIFFVIACAVTILVLIQHRQQSNAARASEVTRADRELDATVARLRGTPDVQATVGDMVKVCANAVACDQQYKGKVVRITGVMRRLEAQGEHRLVVITSGDDGFGTVGCLAMNDDGVLGSLAPGGRIFARGIGVGAVDGEPVLAPCIVEH